MPIITLTSDWGLKDHYLAAVKGSILSSLPGANIVDISHQVEPFDLKQAAFLVRNTYPHFPKGSVHIISIQSEETTQYSHVAVEIEGQFFIGNDNGIFPMIFDRLPDKIIEMNIPHDTDKFTFPTRDRFVKAAVHLLKGSAIEELGHPKAIWSEQILFKPVISGNVIKGIIIYVDNYENVVTNITEELFNAQVKGRKFLIECRGESIASISQSYLDVPMGEPLALFSSTGNLEIAINQGKASSLLGLYMSDPVRVEFF